MNLIVIIIEYQFNEEFEAEYKKKNKWTWMEIKRKKLNDKERITIEGIKFK